jgi:small conductance mechanosensitive channel
MSFDEVWNNIKSFVATDGWRIVAFFAVLLVGILLVRLIVRTLKRAFFRSPMNKTLGGFLCSIIRFLLYILLMFLLAGIVKIDLAPLTTLLLSAGLAISLAIQDSLTNVASGVIIIATNPFSLGDYIETSSVSGTVRRIGMISTELITPDNRKVTIPNTKLTGDSIINLSARPTRRVDFDVKISTNTDISKVREVLIKTLSSHEKALDNPPPVVKVKGREESAIALTARVWVNTEDYWDVFWDLNERILIDLKENGIEIPFSTLTVNLAAAGEEKQ